MAKAEAAPGMLQSEGIWRVLRLVMASGSFPVSFLLVGSSLRFSSTGV